MAAFNVSSIILAFVPFGLFFPLLSRKNRGFWKVALISFEVSLLVELIQLVTRVGSCDVDDMILNTLGGIVCSLFDIYPVSFQMAHCFMPWQPSTAAHCFAPYCS